MLPQTTSLAAVQCAEPRVTEAPAEAERLHLRAADLKQALERTNRIFAEKVARFRERVASGDVELFPAKEPLSIDWK